DQLAALDGDVEFVPREARHGQRDAQLVVAGLFEVVGRVPVSGALGGAFEQPFQVVDAEQTRAVEVDVAVHFKALLPSGFGYAFGPRESGRYSVLWPGKGATFW